MPQRLQLSGGRVDVADPDAEVHRAEMAPLAAAVVAGRVEDDGLDRRALGGHRHRHVLGGQGLRVVPGRLVPRRHRIEELDRLEEQLREPEPLVERARAGHVGDAEGDVVDTLGSRGARQ